MKQVRATGPVDPKGLLEFGAIPWTLVRKTADESVSASTTYQDDDELTFTGSSGTVYEFEFALIYASPAGGSTPDIKIMPGEDATVRGTWCPITGRLDASESVGNTARILALNAGSGDLNAATAAGKRVFKGAGWYVSAGSAFKIRWAQNTSDANPTIVYAGSYLRYRALI